MRSAKKKCTISKMLGHQDELKWQIRTLLLDYGICMDGIFKKWRKEEQVGGGRKSRVAEPRQQDKNVSNKSRSSRSGSSSSRRGRRKNRKSRSTRKSWNTV